MAFFVILQKIQQMKIEKFLQEKIKETLNKLYGVDFPEETIQIQETRKEFKGDYTVVVFPFLKASKKAPEATANEIGENLKANCQAIGEFNAVKGFLNITLSLALWLDQLKEIEKTENFGIVPITADSQLVMVEYSSPNTNKPLHLGHVRNNLLGYSLACILKANGNKVVKTNIVNDRGIHICKSMLAWKKWGEGITPEKAGKKGDHLIGDFYVLFDKKYREEVNSLMTTGLSKEEAEAASPLMEEAREMLRKWEAGDQEIRTLWSMMNEWVYAGFDETYKALGVDFDKIYYESETYLEGKDLVLEGLKEGKMYKREDGSVWADLTSEGLDEKLLLRADGTSVYMTQDIGTAKQRYEDYPIDRMVYVVGNEQNYHFKVLSIILDRLGFKWGKDLVHFSYGMVELPEGKMKSREGTVVDADDLIESMITDAREAAGSHFDGMSEEEAAEVSRKVGLGALKYFLLKVDPKKNMMFNPAESIDFNGNTGPFLQYTYARICSLMRNAAEKGIEIVELDSTKALPNEKESTLIRKISSLPSVIKEAGDNFSPALIANYAYDLAKEYNQYYHDYPVMKEENEAIRNLRLHLASEVARTLNTALSLLGMEMPERM